jgi:hypothetical protein
MRSKVAADVSRTRREQLAAMSPAERIAVAERLGAEGILAFMTSHGVDRQTAIRRIKATRGMGRRYSACGTADER